MASAASSRCVICFRLWPSSLWASAPRLAKAGLCFRRARPNAFGLLERCSAPIHGLLCSMSRFWDWSETSARLAGSGATSVGKQHVAVRHPRRRRDARLRSRLGHRKWAARRRWRAASPRADAVLALSPDATDQEHVLRRIAANGDWKRIRLETGRIVTEHFRANEQTA